MRNLIFFVGFVVSHFAYGNIEAPKVSADLSKSSYDEATWKSSKPFTVSLLGQPMAPPMPSKTNTQNISVQAVHDGQLIAFRLKWKAKSANFAGKIGEFSDAIAMQFPVKEGAPPPVFMGAKESPVHIFHWRAQYQRDLEKGKPQMTDLYPNMNPDMYPMEFKDQGKVEGLTEENREVYSPAKASGNPQSYGHASAVDEIMAEGFGSSAVIQNREAKGRGVWKNGEWTVVITRPLVREEGSTLKVGKPAFTAFAVWQGAEKEVGSRKSVTMSWIPLNIKE